MATRKKETVLYGDRVQKDIENGRPLAPVMYVYGDDPYQIRAIIQAVTNRVQPGFKDFNLHQVTGGELTGEHLEALAQQLPVMDEQCVVLVREANQLGKPDWTYLNNYLENPSPTTCLVFVVQDKDSGIDKRTKTGKLLAKYAVQCRKPFDNRIPDWLSQRAQQYQLRLSHEVTKRLIDLLGTELSALDNALQRIALYLGKGGGVSLEVIESLAFGDRDYNIFELVKLVGQRHFEQALRYLRGALQRGEQPLKFLALLAKTFRELLSARCIYDKGEQSLKAFDSFINPKLRYQRDRYIKEFLMQVKSFSREELIRALWLMHRSDLAIKSSSGLTQELLLERLLMELCLPSGSHPQQQHPPMPR